MCKRISQGTRSAHLPKMASREDSLRHRGRENVDLAEQNGQKQTNSAQKTGKMSLGSDLGSFLENFSKQASNASSKRQTPASQPRHYRTAHDHAMAVQQWLWQCQIWHSMNLAYMTSFPMYAASMMSFQQWNQNQNLPNGGVGTGVTEVGGAGAGPAPAPGLLGGLGRVAQPAGEGDQNNVDIGVRFKIPSLWKRVTAEFIDFFVLFLIKLAVTILTVEYVGIVDIQKYDLDLLLSQNIDYNTAFAMTSELIAMEIINRIFICIFETLCLRRGVAGTVGGTTPGKSVMGLRVVSCEHIYDGPGPRTIRVLPAGDIGIWNALVRSVIKNFSLAFFFPVCFTVFFFQHNRAAYDIISNCIVVELT